MTSENHLLFGPKDILAVRIICKKCKAVCSMRPGRWQRVLYACSNCGEQLMQGHSGEERAIEALRLALEKILEVENDRFFVEFELHNS